MKIFLDSADTNAIKKLLPTGLVDGITTNPSLLSKTGGDPKKHITEICALLPHGDISVEVTEQNPEAVYKQAKNIAALSSNIFVKIPCHRTYYPVIQRLAKEGAKLNITLVFTLTQSLFMAKLGVNYISPFVGRWDDIEVDGAQLLHDIRDMIDQYGFETQILAASLRHVRHFHEAIIAGADAATLPVELFEKSMDHLLSEQGIEKFNTDWAKLNISQFP